MRRCGLLPGLLLLFAALSLTGRGFAQETPPPSEGAGVVEITSPANGEQLFGLVSITGTVTHPSLFGGYVLEWSNIQSPDVWLPIQDQIAQQVNNGVLGQWDTVARGVPDGMSQIRLTLFLTDGSVQTAQVSNLVLINSAPTNIPAAPPTATQPLPPTAGPSPTSLIPQPPTITPRPTFEGGGSAPQNTDTGSGEEAFFNFGAVQSAFCSGVYFSVAFFALIVAYLVIRGRVSPVTRRIWWQIRNELEDDQRDF